MCGGMGLPELLIILAIVLSSAMIWFINYFEGRMAALLVVG